MSEDRPFVLLTQDVCVSCERLKAILAKPLKGAFDDRIEVVHLQANEERFRSLVRHYDARKTPMLIHRESGRRLLDDGSLFEIKAFLNS